MKSFRAAAAKATLFVLGLGSVARADDLQTILQQGRPCPLVFDLLNGGRWRDLSPTLNDLLLRPGFTFCATGLA